MEAPIAEPKGASVFSTFGAALIAILTSVGLFAPADPSAAGLAAGAAIAVTLMALALCLQGPPAVATTSRIRPQRSIGVSVLLSQSDPDAAGHARSRAPGRAASAV